MSETLVQEVEAKVEAVASEVKNKVVEVAKEVEAVVEKTIQELTAEEKLGIREIENIYLKTQMEIQRLSQTTQKAQADFTQSVENLGKKYVIDPSKWVFDNVKLAFVKK